MEIEALEIFLEIVGQGNFSRVARRRNLAVSSVTRKIDHLEQDFGLALFNRSSHSLQLTDAGRQLLVAARRIVAELADARDAMQDTQGEARGTLVVAAPATFGRRHVAPAIASFLLLHPGMEVELHIGDEMMDLETRRIDVAIRIGVMADSDLLATCLAPQQRIAVASPAYLERHGRPAAPTDLVAHDCLTHGDIARRAGWWVFSGVNQGKPLAVSGRLRCDDSDALLSATLAGVGIAHLATWLVAQEIRRGALVALFAQEPAPAASSGSGIHAVRLSGRSVGRARLFIDHLRRAFFPDGGERPYWDTGFSNGW